MNSGPGLPGISGVPMGKRMDYMTDREVGHVLAALLPQNRLVCEVMLHTGLRVDDVLHLRTDEVKRQFYITEHKTGKRKRVNLTQDLVDRIRAQAGDEWAFPGRDPEQPKTRQAVWYDLKRASRAFRVPARVGPHSFRKCYAVSHFSDTKDLGKVQRALNHDRPEVTMIYCMADKLRTNFTDS